MSDADRPLIFIGLLITGLGLYLAAGGRLPPLGRLPGDIVIERENATIYIPITSMILLSLALTAAFRLYAWLSRGCGGRAGHFAIVPRRTAVA